MEEVLIPENKINDNEVLDIAMEIGINMLKSGAEISRVEDTITHICRSYGADEVDCFAIPNVIITTIEHDSKTYTSKVKRNYKMTNNLYRIEAYNQLSRDIEATKPSLEEVREKIHAIQTNKVYHTIIVLLSSFCAAFGCALFFGGTILDSIAAGLIGILMQSLSYIKTLGKHKTILILLSSIIGGLFSVLFVKIGFATHLSYVMIGGVMILIPGIYIGTSLKDIIIGDILSGSIRLVQAVSASIAIASGFSMWSVIFKMDIAFTNQNPVWVLFIATLVASIGYGIMFNVKKNKIPFIAIGGLLVTGVYVIFTYYVHIGSTCFFPVLLAVATGASYAEILARIIKAPAITVMLPSIIVLVPGASLFFTMHKLIEFSGEFQAYLTTTLLASLGIALGMVISQIVGITLKEIIKYRQRKKVRV